MPQLSEYMYCSQQICIPPTFPYLLRQYAKAAIRTQPTDLLKWSTAYFRCLALDLPPPVKPRLEYPVPKSHVGITPGWLKALLYQMQNAMTVSFKFLWDRWIGACLTHESLVEILCLGGFTNNLAIPWLRFVALCAAHLTENLTQTMILICEILTEEPEGGSAMITVDVFTDLYKYLASIDASQPQLLKNYYFTEAVLGLYAEPPKPPKKKQAEIESIGTAEEAEVEEEEEIKIESEVAIDDTGSLAISCPDLASDDFKPDEDFAALEEQSQVEEYLAEGEETVAEEKEAKDEEGEAEQEAPKTTEAQPEEEKPPQEEQQPADEATPHEEEQLPEEGEEGEEHEEEAKPSEEAPPIEMEVQAQSSMALLEPDIDFTESKMSVGDADEEEGSEEGKDETRASGDLSVDTLVGIENMPRRESSVMEAGMQLDLDHFKTYQETKGEEDIDYEEYKRALAAQFDERSPSYDAKFGHYVTKEEEKKEEEVEPMVEEEEEVDKGEDVYVEAVPGIGPVVPLRLVKAVVTYMEGVAVDQHGMVMPRNIRHFTCPPLEVMEV